MASCRILVVDDHPLMRDAMCSLIGEVSSVDLDAIHDACSGEVAVAHARECRPEMILMDIGLPGISGLEAAREIRREMPATAIVMVTAVEEPGQREEGAELGATGFLVKHELAAELPGMLSPALGPSGRAP
jgi:DNA-binding NarL/FixJ family response regulator